MAVADGGPEEDAGDTGAVSDGSDCPARLERLEQRVARLEERLAAQEPGPAGSSPEAPQGTETLWALNGLKARAKGVSAVLFTGSVSVPTGRHYEWQLSTLASQLLDEDWAPTGDALAALGHPVRLTLVRRVLNGADTSAELGGLDELGTSGQLYHHLRQLVSAGWLRQTSRGRYEVPPGRVIPLLVIISAAVR
jgi:hypothetical protein